MSIFKKLFGRNREIIPAPEGVCPNCWGRQEYQDKVYQAIKHKGREFNKLGNKKGWIDAYAQEQFKEIWLRKTGDNNTCPTCQVEYKEV
jgi:hypothetical protein